MSGEKYIVASNDKPLQIAVRNILNPEGYFYLSTCDEIFSLMRQLASLEPHFVVIDNCFNTKDVKHTIEVIEEDMGCAIVLLGDNKETKICDILDSSKYLLTCPKPPTRELLIYSVDMAIVNHKRITLLNKKLNEVTSNFETRKYVELAKGILMQRESLLEDDAYIKIRKKSMDSRMSLKAIAKAIVEGQDIFQS